VRGRFFLAGVAAIALVGLACNALTGVEDLAVCEGAECATIGSGPGEGGSGTEGGGGVDGGEDATLPATCNGDEKRCSGTLAAHCVGGKFETTQCAELCVDGDCIAFPSCRNAAGNTCGGADAGADGGVGSCCETLEVQGGTFNRNNDSTKAASVSTFKLDKYEVTVGRFRAFVEAGEGNLAKPPAAGVGAHPLIMNSGWNAEWNDPVKTLLPATSDALKAQLAGGTWTANPGANEILPITNVSWFVAFAFCAWDGGRLPTNAEWNYAAAGGSEQRLYPWMGTDIDESYASFDCDYSGPEYKCVPVFGLRCSDGTGCSSAGSLCANGSTCSSVQTGTSCTGCASYPAEIAFVGALPKGAGRWGQFELAGNVAEWTLDASGDKDNIILPTPCNDCASLVPPNPQGLSGGGNDDTFMVTRGGHWNVLDTSTPLRNTSADAEQFETRSQTIGFRCARK
jgi:formylglycine-generating enzyme